VQGPVPRSAVTDRGSHDDSAEKQVSHGCALFTIRKLWIEARDKDADKGQPPSTQAATA
jgi:hypothetical protein